MTDKDITKPIESTRSCEDGSMGCESDGLSDYAEENDHMDHSTTTHDTCTATGKEESTESSIQEKMAQKESRNVFRLRLVVVLVLLLAAGAVSYVVYRLTKDGEAEEFRTQYEAAAEKIIESFEDIMHKMGSISSLGVSYTAYSVNFESSYPFVTLPNFAIRAGDALHMSGALFVGFAPVVTREHFEEWDQYVCGDENKWIDDIVVYQERLGVNDFHCEECHHRTSISDRKVDLMHRFDSEGNAVREENPEGPYFPLWTQSPYVNTSGLVNHNIIYRSNVSELVANIMSTESAFVGPILKGPPGNTSSENSRTALFAALRSVHERQEVLYNGEPFAELFLPVFDQFNETERNVIGILAAVIQWEHYLENILPNSVKGIEVVIDYECDAENNLVADTDINGVDTSFTYRLDGAEARFLGYGDQHYGFDDWMRYGNLITDNLDDGTVSGIDVDAQCAYDIHVFPGQEFHQTYNTSLPAVITASIAAVFVFTILAFFLYDHLVEYRQKIILTKAKQSTAIVSSLFPKNVRDRLLEDDGHGNFGLGTKSKIKGFLNGNDDVNSSTAAPIADLFPKCTVLFADVVGFTAWSSQREPAQVFILLQSLFQKFDAQAKRRRVFKVETIGDCYMAATGLPEPQEKHALIMVRFAWECVQALSHVTKQLECTLGPDTADLGIRIGIHSGPVTAGVLRGDRARFQLFGDTVNTASRMESLGCRGKIQVSEATSKLIIDSGKEHWLTPREDAVRAKGKGVLKTFFVNPSAARGSSESGESSSDNAGSVSQPERFIPDANARLVAWVVDLFVKDIKKILHAREHSSTTPTTENIVYRPPPNRICLDEITRSVHMSDYNASIAACKSDHDFIKLDKKVMEQLHDLVGTIASMYRNNPFHNFEHACHVTMSVKKLLSRVVAPELTPQQLESLAKKKHRHDLACQLHEMTYGINSEPLALVALTFSALIHDVDHRGISNMQLMKEDPAMGELYRGKAIAEQNSLDLAWDLFMQDRFQDLRHCIFSNQEELQRFRQLVVNIVIATDIFDKDLNGQRLTRWQQAFADNSSADFDSDLRATIVLEHVIQASDVSHTMQHWHVYTRWNRRLFRELTFAFRSGRLAKDPATFWYRGELGFFDNYIIPLAGKLKDCGVFGVSSDEYLSYAVQNRNEWQERGEELLKDMVAELEMEAK